jgi:hypothetical protein
MTASPNATPDDPTQRIAAATVLYYQQLDGAPPTALELVAWLEKLLPRVQVQLFQQGLRQCLMLPAFQRYVLSTRGGSLHAFLEGRLAATDFASWLRQETARPVQ